MSVRNLGLEVLLIFAGSFKPGVHTKVTDTGVYTNYDSHTPSCKAQSFLNLELCSNGY